jgi:hypothetical protein
LTTSGTAANPICFVAANARVPVIDGENGEYCLWLGTAAAEIKYIIIDGFTLIDADNGAPTSPNAFAVRSDNGSFITMKNCKTTGCHYGFAAYRANGYDHDLWVTNNEFTGNNSPWRTQATPNNANGVLVNGNNNVVSYNTIKYFYDGIRNSDNVTSANEVYSLDVHNNYVSGCYDDNIEIDKVWHNIRVYKNACFNALTTISAQPVKGGPYYTVCNLIYNTSSTNMKWANTPAGMITVNNTYCCNSSSFTNKEPFTNVITKNNYVIANPLVHNWISPVTADSYIDEFDYSAFYSGAGYTDYSYGRWGSATYYEGISAIYAGTGYEQNSRGSDPASSVTTWGGAYPTESTEYNVSSFDFRPTVGSNLRGNGIYVPGINLVGITPDIGAYQYGDSIPQYGKTW